MPSFDEVEQAFLEQAYDVLPALDIARRTTVALAEVIEGAHIPPEESPTLSYFVKSATMLLAVMGLRTARACLLVVSAGYSPESHGLKRRLSEIHARAQAVADDTSGQHAREWLEGRGPSTPARLFNKFGSADLWSLYSWGAHADAQSVQYWLGIPMPEVDEAHRGIVVPPHHDERLSNALLVECAMECRDLVMAQSVCRDHSREGVEAARARVALLDPDIETMISRYYTPLEDSDT